MVLLNFFEGVLRFWLTGYNEVKYWKRRDCVVGNKRCTKLWRYYCFLYCKKTENRQNASLGTEFSNSAHFSTPPNFPHRLSGIFVAGGVRVGSNATILQHVTIGKSKGQVPIIGDNVMIGTGATIIGGVTVGDNCKIGANAIVTKDVPPNTTIVQQPPRYLTNISSQAKSAF